MPSTRDLVWAQRQIVELRPLGRSVRRAFLSLAVCLFAASVARGQSTGSCMPWPSALVPFDSVYYVSQTTSAGDRLAVGNMPLSTFLTLRSQLSAPEYVNQEFCGSVKLASGLYAKAYVPTPNEWAGDFSYSGRVLRDPFTANNPANGFPFPGGIIPASRIPTDVRLAHR
ncbi:MAG: hypothetical protein ACJ74Y_08835 [Bryobacteraceae bacterium]